jgi:hypothetical protein
MCHVSYLIGQVIDSKTQSNVLSQVVVTSNSKPGVPVLSAVDWSEGGQKACVATATVTAFVSGAALMVD